MTKSCPTAQMAPKKSAKKRLDLRKYSPLVETHESYSSALERKDTRGTSRSLHTSSEREQIPETLLSDIPDLPHECASSSSQSSTNSFINSSMNSSAFVVSSSPPQTPSKTPSQTPSKRAKKRPPATHMPSISSFFSPSPKKRAKAAGMEKQPAAQVTPSPQKEKEPQRKVRWGLFWVYFSKIANRT